MKKLITNVFYNCFLAAFCLLVITGCSSVKPVYEEMPPLPEYKPSEKQYNKSAIIRIIPSDTPELDKVLKANFVKSEYVNLNQTENFFREIPANLKLVKIIDVKHQTYKQKKGTYIEARIIVMIRKPGYVINKKLELKNSNVRCFQAYARLLSRRQGPAQYGKVSRIAIQNLFTMDEFLSALEPEKNEKHKQIVQRLPNPSAEICWNNSIAAKNNGDEYEAIYWALNAAERGHKEAAQFCTTEIRLGNLNVKNPEFLNRLANSGDPAAQYTLANSLKNSDTKTAVMWLKRCAEQNYLPGQMYLAFMYEYGSGVSKDIETAIKYYMMAAKQGNSFAQKKVQKYFEEKQKKEVGQK